MTLIHPIRATHYNPRSIDLSDVIIPPYDAIAPERMPAYLNRSPYNLAHVIMPNANDPKYTLASQRLRQWKSTGVLIEEPHPAYYLYRQEFTLGHKKHMRDTFMCAVELHDYSDGVVLPHENTYQKYRTDRLNILRKTQHQMSHIFAMVQDPEAIVSTVFERFAFEAPFLMATDDDGTRHILWRAEPNRVEPIVGSLFKTQPIYIVDGHHRYNSALEYARETGVLGSATHPAAQVLFCIANTFDPALIVFPTHRLIQDTTVSHESVQSALDSYLQTPIEFEELARFVTVNQRNPQFAVYYQGRLNLCSPKNPSAHAQAWGNTTSQLAVAWSDWELLSHIGITDHNRAERVTYERDIHKAWALRNDFHLSVYHAPIPVERVCGVADERRFMPQKTTYFYPKIAAGFILRNVGTAAQ